MPINKRINKYVANEVICVAQKMFDNDLDETISMMDDNERITVENVAAWAETTLEYYEPGCNPLNIEQLCIVAQFHDYIAGFLLSLRREI